jgi:hypothetical protein
LSGLSARKIHFKSWIRAQPAVHIQHAAQQLQKKPLILHKHASHFAARGWDFLFSCHVSGE